MKVFMELDVVVRRAYAVADAMIAEWRKGEIGYNSV